MNKEQAKEIYEDFQLMDDEITRQWKDYYMAKGEWDIVWALDGLIVEEPPIKIKKMTRPKNNHKKMQKQKLLAAKEQEKELRKQLFKSLNQESVVKIESWVYPLLRRINRSNPKDDIELSAQFVFNKTQAAEIKIEFQLIKDYIKKRMDIINKYPSVVKKKKKSASLEKWIIK